MKRTRTHLTRRSLFALPLLTPLFSLPFAALAQAPEPLVLRGAAWEAGFDRRTGRLLFVRAQRDGDAPAQTLTATPPEGSLWQITFRDGRTQRAADFAQERVGSMRPEWLADGALRLTYTAKAATVVVEAERTSRMPSPPGGDYLDLRLRLTAADGEILTAALPADLHLAASIQPSPPKGGVSGRPDTFPAPLRRFLEAGGVWVETGGYPFFFALPHLHVPLLQRHLHPDGAADDERSDPPRPAPPDPESAGAAGGLRHDGDRIQPGRARLHADAGPDYLAYRLLRLAGEQLEQPDPTESGGGARRAARRAVRPGPLPPERGDLRLPVPSGRLRARHGVRAGLHLDARDDPLGAQGPDAALLGPEGLPGGPPRE